MRKLDPRERFQQVFPAWMQPAITWLSGCALSGQSPLMPCTPASKIIVAYLLVLLGGGLASSAACALQLQVEPGAIAQLMAGWLLLVGGARRCQVELSHYAIHNRVFNNAMLNRGMVELHSVVFVIQDYAGYYRDHIKLGHHRADVFCGPNDPDWQFLKTLGLKAGMSPAQCWQWLALTCVSPAFHLRFLMARVRANLCSDNRYRRLMSVCWLTVVVTGVSVSHAWVAFLLAWLLPLTVLYHISALLQFTSEHKWNSPRLAGESARTRHIRLSHARYSMRPLPERTDYPSGTRAVLALLGWAVLTIAVDVPIRLFCLVGDMPVHHMHHGNAAEKEWALAVYLDAAPVDGPTSPVYWGLFAALEGVFEHLSGLAPDLE